MISSSFIIVAAIVILVADALYAVDTLMGRNKPNRLTWALWSLAPLIAFASQRSENVGPETLLTLAAGIAPMLVLAASFYNKKSYWKITRFDIYCGAVSLLALAVLVIFNDGLLALGISIVADLFAGLPTVIKAWKDPASESVLPFALGAVSALITLLTIHTWSFSVAAFAVYILYMNVLLAFLASRGKYGNFSV